MEDAPPPTEHVLRPHHVALLSILMIAFKDLEIKKLPAPFALHLHRVLLQEIAEVAQPKSHQELMKELASGPRADSKECSQFLQAIKTVHVDIHSTEKMGNFLGNLPALFIEKVLEENPRFMRRSFFGYFCRRCFVSYLKLSFSGLSKLRRDYQAWCAGDSLAGYEIIMKGDLTIDYLLHKTQSDRKVWAKPEAYGVFEKGQIVGDENLAVENLRRFFEQHFHDQIDSTYRQHAMLNLVHMHYIRGENEAARKYLVEAIEAARAVSDRLTLQHCMSMMHRLSPPSGEKPIINDVQPDMHPLEVLYDVKKLLDEQNEQPLIAAFIKIVQAMGLYDHWLDVQFAAPVDGHQWAQHSVQSIIWREAGCDQLATVAENIVLAFTDSGGDNSNRLIVLLNRAYKIARQGRYNEAIAMLLEPPVWRGISLTDFGSWAHEIWSILALRAVRRGQGRQYREFLLPRRPQGTWSAKYYQFDQSGDELPNIRESLYHVLSMGQHDQAATVVDHLLRALWQSEFLFRMNLYRTGIILLADIGLEFGMPKNSKRILEEILPQIIMGEDLEQRAVACFTLARCIIAAGGVQAEVFREALRYLLIAEGDFKKMGIYRSLKDVQYWLAVVYENLGMQMERDAAAKSYEETEVQERMQGNVVVDEEIHEIFELIAIVGAALANR